MNRTKKAISVAFWQLLEEKPFNKIMVQNIVGCCQINRNTFYYHFQDIPALAEYSIKAWTEQVIDNNCEFGSPINCISPIVQEFIKRKTAFIHIYRSSHKEAFILYINKISQHIVQSYINSAIKNMDISLEDKLAFVKYYKCTFAGVVLDWLDIERPLYQRKSQMLRQGQRESEGRLYPQSLFEKFIQICRHIFKMATMRGSIIC